MLHIFELHIFYPMLSNNLLQFPLIYKLLKQIFLSNSDIHLVSFQKQKGKLIRQIMWNTGISFVPTAFNNDAM